MTTPRYQLNGDQIHKANGTHQWPPDYNSGGENDLLIIVSAAVFGFPAVVIIIICLLRLRVHYLDKRDKANGRRVRAEESTLLANEDAGGGCGGCGAPMHDLKRHRKGDHHHPQASLSNHNSNHSHTGHTPESSGSATHNHTQDGCVGAGATGEMCNPALIAPGQEDEHPASGRSRSLQIDRGQEEESIEGDLEDERLVINLPEEVGLC